MANNVEVEVEVETDVVVEVTSTLVGEVLHLQVDTTNKMNRETMKIHQSKTTTQIGRSYTIMRKPTRVKLVVKFVKDLIMRLLIVGTGMITLISLKTFHKL